MLLLRQAECEDQKNEDEYSGNSDADLMRAQIRTDHLVHHEPDDSEDQERDDDRNGTGWTHR